MRRRWRAWRRRQRSAITYAFVPAPPRLTQSGRLVYADRPRLVEVQTRWL